MGKHLHHRPATNPQPTPAHLTRRPRPAQRSPTPPATNPPQPRTPVPHAPKRASPHTRTRPAPTNPTPTPESPSDSPVGGFRLRRRTRKRCFCERATFGTRGQPTRRPFKRRTRVTPTPGPPPLSQRPAQRVVGFNAPRNSYRAAITPVKMTQPAHKSYQSLKSHQKGSKSDLFRFGG